MARRDTFLIVLPSLTLGGCETQGLFYAKAIADTGLGTPLFVNLGREGELVPLLQLNGFKFITVNSSNYIEVGRWGKLIFLIRFCITLRKTRPLAIIAQSHWPNLFAGIVWRFTGAKKFFWIQGSLDHTIQMTVWEQIAIWMRPTYMANSKASSDFIVHQHRLRSEPDIIYNGLKIPDKVGRHKLGPLQLVMVANFFPEKDHATVLHAFALLLKDFPDARLHLVGKSPGNSLKMKEMKALACDLRLSSNVVFHGAVKNVTPLLRMADIGILSTYSEGLSNSLLEYMAYGLPIVATNIAPNEEALGRDNAPWLFSPGDVLTMTTLLKKLCSDDELRLNVGDHNHQQAMARFSLKVFSARFITGLQESLQSDPPAL